VEAGTPQLGQDQPDPCGQSGRAEGGGGTAVLSGTSLAPAAPTLVHAPDGCVLGCQVRPGSRCVWNKVGDL